MSTSINLIGDTGTGTSVVNISGVNLSEYAKLDGADFTVAPTVNGAPIGGGTQSPVDYSDILNKPTLFSGAYADLNGTPTLGTAAATSKTEYATAAQGVLADNAIQASDLGAVATSNDYTDLNNKPTLFSGAYADLTGTPSIPDVTGLQEQIAVFPDVTYRVQGGMLELNADGKSLHYTPSLAVGTAAQTNDYNDLDNKPTLFSGVYADLSGLPTLGTGGFSGAYADLTGLPTLGTAAATSKTKYATAAQGVLADNAIQGSDLGAVATSNDYTDLNNKPTIPSISGLQEQITVQNSQTNTVVGGSIAMIDSKTILYTPATVNVSVVPDLTQIYETLRDLQILNAFHLDVPLTTLAVGNVTLAGFVQEGWMSQVSLAPEITTNSTGDTFSFAKTGVYEINVNVEVYGVGDYTKVSVIKNGSETIGRNYYYQENVAHQQVRVLCVSVMNRMVDGDSIQIILFSDGATVYGTTNGIKMTRLSIKTLRCSVPDTTTSNSSSSYGGGSSNSNSNSTAPTTNGLIMKLDSSDTASYSGSGTTWSDVSVGTAYNATLYESMNVSAGATLNSEAGGVLVFDGVDDWTKVDSLSDFFRGRIGSFTFQTWVKPTYNLSSAHGTVLLSMHNGVSNRLRWQISNDKISVFDLPTIVEVYANHDTLAPNVWRQYTFVGDHVTNQITLYVDTSEITTVSMKHLNYWHDVDRVSIGQEWDGNPERTSEYFQGSMGLFLTYDRALTASDVASNYEATKVRFGY